MTRFNPEMTGGLASTEYIGINYGNSKRRLIPNWLKVVIGVGVFAFLAYPLVNELMLTAVAGN